MTSHKSLSVTRPSATTVPARLLRTRNTVLSIMFAIFVCAGPVADAQTNPKPLVITGNSLVRMAPWSQSGIVPPPVIRGHDGYTCAMLSVLLPYDVPEGTSAAVLVEATNDVRTGVSPEDHIACVEAEVAWLLTNRPRIRVVVVNTPPFALGNCYGDYRRQIEAYDALYAQLPETFAGSPVTVADVWTDVTQPNGWAWFGDMDGPCLIHPGQPGVMNAGWAAFMGQIKQQVTP